MIVKKNTNRTLDLGLLLWLSTLQFFIVQLVVASVWVNPSYSWSGRTISELGATICGHVDGRYMCSPMHDLMNISFVLLGLAMTAGSIILYKNLKQGRTGFTLMSMAGLGAMMVGFVPMDTVYWLHIVGADIAFLMGNIAIIVLGLTLRISRWLKWFSVASGGVAILGLVLFLTHNHLFLGLGGMERVVAYPIVIWLAVFAIYGIRNRSDITL